MNGCLLIYSSVRQHLALSYSATILSITPCPYSMSILARWDVLFAMSDVRILLYLEEKGQARYSELLGKVLNSRSTLATSLRDLQNMGLVKRIVKGTRPIQTYYTLTDRGQTVLDHLMEIKKLTTKS